LPFAEFPNRPNCHHWYGSNSKSKNAFCIITWGEIFEKHHSIYSGQITSLTVYQQMFDFHFFVWKQKDEERFSKVRLGICHC
jgi:hypothetical protein